MIKKQSNKYTLTEYCDKFASLKISSTKKLGNAGYKPILLLSVIELINRDIITENKILVSDNLINTFEEYWRVFASDSLYKGGLHYPFFHLQSEGFWHLKLKPDFNGLQPKTTKKLKECVEYATLDDELFDLLQDSENRRILIDTLISVWFAFSKQQEEDIIQVNQNFSEIETVEAKTINDSLEKDTFKYYLKKSIVRNALFRKTIVHAYSYKCAFCQLKVIRSLTQNIVDGAHIKPLSRFYDNRIDNGISLCKNHHWAFDNGLFSINDDYRIIVIDDLQEESPNAKPMKDFHGELIVLPSSEEYYPRLDAIRWHRQNVFRN
jgi:putative restriction endonuclease